LCINSIGFDQFERRHAAPRLQRGCVRLMAGADIKFRGESQKH
jgi:hypothetical protein